MCALAEGAPGRPLSGSNPQQEGNRKEARVFDNCVSMLKLLEQYTTHGVAEIVEIPLFASSVESKTSKARVFAVGFF